MGAVSYTRHPQWERRLYQAMADWYNKPFVWGESDCCIFAADIVRAVYDVEMFHGCGWEGYQTAQGAYAKLKKKGFDSPQDMMSKIACSVPLGKARRGDIMVKDGALGACDGAKSFFMTEDYGLTAYNTLDCDSAWSFECQR